MADSENHATPSKDWAVPLRFLDGKDGAPIRITGYRISWHAVIYFIGLTVLVRAGLNVPGSATSEAGLAIYTGCVAMSLFIARRFRVRGDAKSSFYSAHLGMLGYAVSTLKPMISQYETPVAPSTVVVPLVALGLLVALVWSTTQLSRRFPAA